MADLRGFQGMAGSRANVLANRWFQPLTHVSDGAFPRDSAISCQRRKREKRGDHRFSVTQSAAQSVRALFRATITMKGPGNE